MQIRSIDDIYSVMINSKDRIIELWNDIQTSVLSDPLLAQLTSTSNTAIFRLWAFITAVQIWIHEYLWQLFKNEIEEIVSKAIPNTANWLRDQLYLFQYGDDLLFSNYDPYYAVVDPVKRIVKQAAVVPTTTGLVLIKVAKKGGLGQPLVPLSALEVSAVEQYIDDIKPAGTITQVLSLNPDKIKILAEVHYDAKYILQDLTNRVNAAIIAFLENLTFNGGLYVAKLQDSIQNVEGVTDVLINYVGAQVGSNPYTNINRLYTSTAGYCIIDPLFPTISTITYLATA